MSPATRFLATLATVGLLALPTAARANDVDGPNDCTRAPVDFGDAPEGVQAYPGVIGAFPTCITAGPVGVANLACSPGGGPIGPAGYVRHTHTAAGGAQYWLGCAPVGVDPLGIDSDLDGKTNDTGLGASACQAGLVVDCVEAAFGLNFGQDERYGSDDAGIGASVSFTPCAQNSVPFRAFLCGTAERPVYVNILVDWNRDGDWNDDIQCTGGACATEWAVRNVLIFLQPGCNNLNSPGFLAGPAEGPGWMRITLSDEPVLVDFPWNGSKSLPGETLTNGETEDYPIHVGNPPPTCPDYEDWGDAPEEAQAYAGILGHFPTCSFLSGPGTYDVVCLPARSTPPGPTGHVRHISTATDAMKFWLGCGSPATGSLGVDGEIDGKTNDNGLPPSICNSNVLVDCTEPFGLNWGQDECYGDGVDAGLAGPLQVFNACQDATVDFNAYNCTPQQVVVYLNILVDMNKDGDWNDNFHCGSAANPQCAYEWVVKNQSITLNPGCQLLTSPAFLVGPNAGAGWMRITLTADRVTDDFPWAGSIAGAGNDSFRGGETEDYLVRIDNPPPPCPDYEDWGDAPEEAQAYPGVLAHFPTCSFLSGPGTQETDCLPARSSAPGPTGHVRHLSLPTANQKFWLGCGSPALGLPGVDSEVDGKTNDTGGPFSICNPNVPIDCTQWLGLSWGQDECYGDGVDAGLAGPRTIFRACKDNTIEYSAFNCGQQQVDVYLNILVDMNEDGDWNDNFKCSAATGGQCAYEWAVQNVVVSLAPGCQLLTSPAFVVGPRSGKGWLRITLTAEPVSDDFPWNGSAGPGGDGIFFAGETEDYPVVIRPDNVGVDEEVRGGSLMLAPPSPNPASKDVQLRFALPVAAEVTMSVYDIAGRRVVELERGLRSAGEHRLSWNFTDASGRSVPAGQYTVRLRVGDRILTQRVMRVP